MGITRKEMKQTAKAGIRSARPHPVLVTLVYTMLTTGMSILVPGILIIRSGAEKFLCWMGMGYNVYDMTYYSMSDAAAAAMMFAHTLIGVFGMVVSFGYLGYTLRVSRGEDARYGNLLEGFGIAGKVILLNILISLFTMLWSMLFIFPGIIAHYRYRMALYIMLDDPDCSALEAIRMSKTMMKGRKMQLFIFDLSFINWILPYVLIGIASVSLCIVSNVLGIVVGSILYALLSLWLMPYFLCSQAVFYDAVCDADMWHKSSGNFGRDVKF